MDHADLDEEGPPRVHPLGAGPPTASPGLREVIFRESTTIGVRELRVRKHALDRVESIVHVDGQPIRVKASSLGADELNRSVEWDDIAAAASVLGRSAKDVLAAATAAASAQTPPDTSRGSTSHEVTEGADAR